MSKRDKYTPLFQECEFRDPETGSYSKDNNWKMSVRVVVDKDKVDDYCRAITHFVGGACSVRMRGNKAVITNKGYYVNIGA